jgi:hypothetical protein
MSSKAGYHLKDFSKIATLYDCTSATVADWLTPNQSVLHLKFESSGSSFKEKYD